MSLVSMVGPKGSFHFRDFLRHGVCWSWMMMVAHPKPNSQYSHDRLPQEEME
jgi:hypothetical protein